MHARILILASDVRFATDIVERLSSLKYSDVNIASCAAEAVRLAVEHPPSIVMIDVRNAGDVDAYSSAKAIWSRVATSIVYLADRQFEQNRIKDRAEDSAALLHLPCDDRELHWTIEAALLKHAAEIKQRSLERRFTSVAENIAEGVIGTDDCGRIIYANTRAETLTGWSQADAQGRTLDEIFCRFDAEGASMLRHRNGSELQIEVTIVPAGDECAGEIIVLRDVTETKRIEQHLCNLQKLESVGQLASGVAHDFNNLLTVILCGARLLKQDRKASADSIDILSEIESAGESGAELARQFVAFSRQQTVKPCLLHVNQVIRDTERFLRRILGTHIELVLRMDERLGTIRADPNQIAQILVNLAMNARDAMPNGGKLIIETSDEWIEVSAQRIPPDLETGRYQVLRVSDTGHGMDANVLCHAFEPFFTTKQAGKGTGLGLAVVSAIVKQTQGYIHATSEISRGTTFNIYFSPTSESLTPAILPSACETPNRPVTILLVEDEDAIRNLCKCILTKSGYRVLAASDGVEALDLAAKHPNSVDLMITDLVMPRMCGVTLIRTMLTRHPKIKVLCVTAQADPSLALLGDNISTLTKPFTPATLGQAVRHMLDRGAYQDEPISAKQSRQIAAVENRRAS